ncbi:MAG: bile acid:sodium symporter family protein [Rhizomicrobium sp.]
MTFLARLSRFRPDNFTLAIATSVVIATFLPVTGRAAANFDVATDCAIALLFFLHGARLSREAVLAGFTHWRLHIVILVSTFVLFPLLGLVIGMAGASFLSPLLITGIIFLCCLPSTVQSSIAFTSIAGGNIPAAICSASASSLLGVFLTPILTGLLLSAHGTGGFSLSSLQAIIMQLLVPFAIGQLMHPLIGGWALRHKKMLSFVDRGSILMVVYGAFSEAVSHGLWHTLALSDLLVILVLDAALLAVALVITTWGARRLGFNRADEIAIVFCGSKKSLASGVPIANILFARSTVGMIVLPLMLFHQIQLMVCAMLARRYAAAAAAAADEPK